MSVPRIILSHNYVQDEHQRSTQAVQNAIDTQASQITAANTNIGNASTQIANLTTQLATVSQQLAAIQNKNTLGPAVYWWNGATTDQNYHPMIVSFVQPGTTNVGGTTYTWTAPRSGSITAIGVNFNAAPNQTWAFRAAINGAATPQLLSATGNSYATFALGAYTFTPGQVIQIQSAVTSSPAASSVVVLAHLEVQLPP